MSPDATTEDVVRRTAMRGPELKKQLARIVRRLLNRHDAAAALFLGEDGKLTPAADKWMRQLARDNFVFGGGFDADPLKLAANTARRDLALEIIGSAKLDVDRLEALTRLEGEI